MQWIKSFWPPQFYASHFVVDALELRRHWLRVTPDLLVIGLLVVECLLWALHWLGGWPHWDKGRAVLTCIVAVGLVMSAMSLWWLVALALRWRFQFSLRSMLVLIVVVAIPCSWLGVEMNNAREQRRTVEAIEASGIVELDYPDENLLRHSWGQFCYGPIPEWQLDKYLAQEHIELNKHDPLVVERLPSVWVRDALGDDFFLNVRTVVLVGPEVTDANLGHVRRLPRLRKLYLTSSRITDSGLKHLRQLKDLQTLKLDDTTVTDAGLVHLAGLRNLQYLFLERTQATDAGLECLVGLAQLKRLDLTDTKVSSTGIEKLRQALPNCEIKR
jgi:hypothetical protein